VGADGLNDGHRTAGERHSFEWWYFDFDVSDTLRVYLEWHAPLFSLRDASCTLMIRIHDRAKPETFRSGRSKSRLITKAFRYPRSSVKQNPDHCDIEFPAGRIFESDGDYHIAVKESGLVIDLLLRQQSAPIAAATEELYRSRRDQSTFAWNIALPRAQSAGVIDLDDRHIEVRGGAYHDHNWGTVVFRRHFLKWIWMRIFFDDFTLIFSEIEALDLNSPPLRPLIFTDRRGRPIATGRPTVEYASGERPGQGPLRLPRGLKIGFTGENVFSVEIEPDPDIAIQEAPSGGFSALWLNAGVHYLYYLLRFRHLPLPLKRWMRLLHYYQGEMKGTLFIDGRRRETKTGKIEVFSCGRK